MKKYAKIIHEETKEVSVALGANPPEDYVEMDVEQAYTGNWYVQGYVSTQPEPNYIDKRLAEYPSIGDQLDMIYWDKVNGTNLWQERITMIKNKYPKN